ncbi:MAG: diguanylate cyclase, partial [Cyanobacteriota bacterium]|nr:diguanylate cyclase [Cyanobacteriota bacterium]
FSESSYKLLDFLSGASTSKQLEVECKTKTERKITVSFSCSIFSKNTLDSQEFLWIGRDVTQQKKLELQLYQQLEQNRLLIEMTQRIRQSLSLENIIQTTVIEVRKLLKVEGVLCYRFSEENNGYILAHSFISNLIRKFQAASQNILIPNHFLPILEQGIITRVDDFNRSHLTTNLRKFRSRFDINSELIIPIIFQDFPIQSASQNNLWGVLIAYQFHRNRRWEEWEILLLEQLTTSIAVAIKQAELYEKLQIGNQELEQMTITDHLTLVVNRKFFDETLLKEWQRMRRESAPLSLILCDLDYFKRYNDTYGRLAGDTCLQEIAQTLNKIGRRSGDLVARYDGEKFAILLPKTDLEGAIFVSEQICSRVRSLQIPNDNSEISSYLTISVGVSSIIPEVPLVPKTLILRADQALHEAKINGGDRVFSAVN